MVGASCQGLVVVIFDTLRADYVELCGGAAHLPQMTRLFSWTRVLPKFVCGSFPTVPMRTDLLTGNLSFLYRQWATPEPGETVLTTVLRNAGVQCILVTDNYVITAPELGASLTHWF